MNARCRARKRARKDALRRARAYQPECQSDRLTGLILAKNDPARHVIRINLGWRYGPMWVDTR